MDQMFQFIAEPTLAAFLFQVILFSSVMPLSLIAYHWARAPMKLEMVDQSLQALSVPASDELRRARRQCIEFAPYIFPLVFATLMIALSYSFTHPYVLRQGVWVGFTEELIDVFSIGALPDRALLAARMIFWAWLGAYTYALNLLVRRFLSYDLSPNVYVFIANRVFTAIAVSGIVGVALAVGAARATDFKISLTTVSVVAFFIGFFPDRGLDWLSAAAKGTLGQTTSLVNELRLSSIEGLSLYHQSRLQQEGIENVQNLATADIPLLAVNVPFPVGQVIDWLDQAILLTYVTTEQNTVLQKAGVRGASHLLMTTAAPDALNRLIDATGLTKSVLLTLRLTVETAINIDMVLRYHATYQAARADVSIEAAIEAGRDPDEPLRLPASDSEQ